MLNYDNAEILAPSVRVLSGGSRRVLHGLGTEKYRNFFRIVIKVYVAAASSDNSWTEQNVEDTLDEIDKRIADVVMDNTNNTTWDKLEYEEGRMSTIAPAVAVRDAGGVAYLLEEHVLIAEVFD